MRERVYRVQDQEGRGPYRPGTSHRWTDPSREALPPPFYDEFPGIFELMQAKTNYGCAFDTLAQLTRWFTPTERHRLEALFYNVVSFEVDRVLARSEHQLVFARKTPLWQAAPIVGWPRT